MLICVVLEPINRELEKTSIGFERQCLRVCLCVCVFTTFFSLRFLPSSLLLTRVPSTSSDKEMAEEPLLFVGNLPPTNVDAVSRFFEDAGIRALHIGM
jgi:hypothetical protein